MKRKLALVGVLLFGLFALFSYLVHKDIFTQFDFNTTVKVQDKVGPQLDYFFSLLSTTGVFEISLIILLIILVALRKLKGIIAFCLFGSFHIFELFGKFFVHHPPPPEFMLRTERIIDFPQFYVRSQFSYPSGHAGRTTFLTLFLGLIIWNSKKLSRTQKIFIVSFLAFYDISMLVSRVYLGEHWTTDVIGGTLLGAALSLLSFVLI